MGVAVLVSLVLLSMAYGTWRSRAISEAVQTSPSLRVGLVQPNVPQRLKWQPDKADHWVSVLTDLSQTAIERGAEIVVWPETSYPDVLPTNLSTLNELADFNSPLVIGAVTLADSRRGRDARSPAIYNSAAQVDPGGLIRGIYHKTHLVPLGEYVPLGDALDFLSHVVTAIGNFMRGSSYLLLDVAGRAVGVTICYEDLFPEISRAFTRGGAELLVNMTNDAWYGDSSNQWQHLEFSRFRAVENRRPMVRSTNTGLTAVIHPDGHVISRLKPFTEDVLVATVPLSKVSSVYSRFGDWPWFISLILVMGCTWCYEKKRRRS